MGKYLAVVGIGPGAVEMMTGRAIEILEACDCIAGYSVYVDLVKERFPGKDFLTTPMRKEEERCLAALREADGGRRVALICSGDAGVYGLAGLIFELGRQFPEVEIEVVPGVTAALSGAALLGAPLIHDFALISLSDLLTPWAKIEKRLRCAAEADFCIVLYNPSSRRRSDYLKKACDILLESLPGDRLCGVARNIGREGASAELMSLEELREAEADMFSTIFIGNASTREIAGRMVTPRGYRAEREERE